MATCGLVTPLDAAGPTATVRVYFTDGGWFEWANVPATQINGVWSVDPVTSTTHTSADVSVITTEIVRRQNKRRVTVLEPFTIYSGGQLTASAQAVSWR